MNRNQYFMISLFFLVLLFLLPYIVGTPLNVEGSTYLSVRNAIFSVIIWLSYPLMILFQILGWLEPKNKQ